MMHVFHGAYCCHRSSVFIVYFYRVFTVTGPVGNYGSTCELMCGQCAADGSCDQITWSCVDNCNPGYTGSNCEEACPSTCGVDGSCLRLSPYCSYARLATMVITVVFNAAVPQGSLVTRFLGSVRQWRSELMLLNILVTNQNQVKSDFFFASQYTKVFKNLSTDAIFISF